MYAIIPARGGSKGLPRKNVLPMSGIPLIAHTIISALKSQCIDKVIVSTDDDEIATISLNYGAYVPFMRPENLATDTALAIDVYLYTIERLMEENNTHINKFMVLLPTAPLRNEVHIDEAYNLFVEKQATTLISVTEAPHSPSWYMNVEDNLVLRSANFAGNGLMVNRQTNSKYYIPNGAIYILDYELLKKQRSYYCDNTIAYIMNPHESIDIDTELDFICAELMMKKEKHNV